MNNAFRVCTHDHQAVPLYHPRRDDWEQHFSFTSDFRLEGRSPAGRATIEALQMNRPAIVAIRRELCLPGRFGSR